MRLQQRTRSDLVRTINKSLARQGELPIAAWELTSILPMIEEVDYPEIDDYWLAADDDVALTEPGRDPLRNDLEELAGRVVDDLLIGRRHTAGYSEQESPVALERLRNEDWLAGNHIYNPPWWAREHRAWLERWRPMQDEALTLVAPAAPRPLPAASVARTLKAIALEEFAPDEGVRMRLPFEETFVGGVRSRWVRLKGPTSQLSLLESLPPAPGTNRLQRLFALATNLARMAECSEPDALGFLLCDAPIWREPVSAVGTWHEGEPHIDIRVNHLDVPLDVVARAYKDERSFMGVARARAMPRRSDWPSVIWEFVEARAPRRRRSGEWPKLFEEFKADPAHVVCPCVMNDNMESFKQTHWNENRRRREKSAKK